jgi:hypothetical protein
MPSLFLVLRLVVVNDELSADRWLFQGLDRKHVDQGRNLIFGNLTFEKSLRDFFWLVEDSVWKTTIGEFYGRLSGS